MTRRFVDTAVIGLGGMGSAALYHLSRRGIPTLGIDQFSPPHSLGSSHGATRIIRLAYYEDPSYVPLLRRAYELWRELEEQTGHDLLRITGSLDVSTMDGGIFPRSLASCELHALPHEVLTSADLPRRFPGYRFPDGYLALHQPDGGILDPERCVGAHLEAAIRAGATTHVDERVVAVEAGAHTTVIRTTTSEYVAERVVLAAGSWTGELVPRLRPLAVPERQVVGWFEPTDATIFAPERFPVFNAQVDEGLLWISLRCVGRRKGRAVSPPGGARRSIDVRSRHPFARRGGAPPVRCALCAGGGWSNGSGRDVPLHEFTR